MKRVSALLAICLCFMVMSCEKDHLGNDLGLARHDIVIDKNGGSILISSKADIDVEELHFFRSGTWERSSDSIFYDVNGNAGLRCDWIKVSMITNGSQTSFIMIEATPNRTGVERACRIGVRNSTSGESITISQKK